MSAEISITLFVLTTSITTFLLPFFVKFSENQSINLIARRGCWVVSFYLMAQNSAIMATIADSAGLNLTNEMFGYMWLFGWGGYLAIAVLFLGTILEIVRNYQSHKFNERMGGDYG